MTFIQTIIFGVIEGVTEFLPISSTGHLILVDYLLQIPATEFVKSFNIAIQLGAILAVVVLYARRLLVNRSLLARVVVAFMPTAMIGFLFYKLVKTYLLNNPSVVVWALFIGGFAIFAVEWYLGRPADKAGRRAAGTKNLETMRYREALVIGLAQSVAIIPGVSRSAATIVGGLLSGFSRTAIVEFSFLLAIPTMLAATSLDLFKSGAIFTGGEWLSLLIGFVVSFAVALVVVKWLLRFIQNHNFKLFGIYRIIIALVFWLVIF
jgi:undecaprenyl-diphosphatase